MAERFTLAPKSAFARLISPVGPTPAGVIVTELVGLGLAAVEPRKGGRVRLCGIAATSLEPRDAPRQLGFDEAARAKGERLGETIDQVAAKFGKGAIRRAVHLPDDDERDE